MINEELKSFLLAKQGKYKFTELVEYMESTSIEINLNPLHNATGFTTVDAIYLNLDNLDRHSDKMIYYIILHEIAHYKRIQKYGFEWMLNKLSVSDFDEYFEGVINEEIFADRFSCYTFYKLNKTIYPWYETQQLNLKNRQEKYKPLANTLFGKINNDKNKYYDLVNQIIT